MNICMSSEMYTMCTMLEQINSEWDFINQNLIDLVVTLQVQTTYMYANSVKLDIITTTYHC